jgi:DNA-binding LytR/AlgR family response regulator
MGRSVGRRDREAVTVRVLVVDDEAPALDELRFLLEREDDVAEVCVAGDATEALRHLRDGAFAAVFLDVSMPGLNGIELARVLSQFADPPQVVFVTAHEQHAVEAFELRAADYLLKPVRTERLIEALSRVRQARQPLVDPVIASGTPDDDLAVIECETGGRTRFVRRDEVRYVEASGDYARLHTAAGSYLVRLPMSLLESRWSAPGFCRVHRSFLVALANVVELRADSVGGTEIVLDDGDTLPVSRRLVRDVKERLRRAASEPGR